eukprot:TRINITY_DN216_c0_g1_i1.p1 TRINITY_DN216_c0_g1~~TRINITY_DN216_c0_g1_i1.p1  ORF type:complete len:317 (+),score=96.46 TRINITY_DN216_c0_g1_i1:34-984(+)
MMMNVGRRALRQQQVVAGTPSLATQAQRRNYPGGAALKSLKHRGATVRQIGKITGTMKVVASSKLPSAQAKAQSVSPFFESMENGLFDSMMTKLKAESDNKSVLTIIIYTDKGLCGSTNNTISRMLDKESMSNQKIIVWGEKGASSFEKSKHASKVIFSAHPPLKNVLTMAEISAVTSKIVTQEFDLIRIIYNKMVGSHSSEIKELWLPSLTTLNNDDAAAFLAPYEIEAVASDELLESLNEYQICAALNYCHFNNQAVELFQRRNSMENASKNAGEIGKKLNILFNKARQAAITTELGEICSGAAAVDEMLKAGK